MSASSEFVTLCQTQVSLVATLGASLSVIYLTEDWVDNTPDKLIPVAAYPDTTVPWLDAQTLLSLPSYRPATQQTILPEEAILPPLATEPIISTAPDENQSPPDPSLEPEQQKIVIPLVHQNVVMGFLVTGRDDRPWSSQEQHQLQAIAHSLTTACLLDRRVQWLQQRYQQQQQVQSQQAQTLRSLLHQLKSPLTALRTFGKLLLKRLLPQDKNHKIADNILQQSDRITDLLQQVDQTLELADTQLNQPLNLNPSTTPALLPSVNFLESVALETVLKPLLASTTAIAEEHQLSFSLNLPPALPPVQGNGQALGEILSNLLDNALKYTPAHGQIELTIQLQESQLGIGISDTGPGIPPADLEHLFERGYRGIQAAGDIPGTGLGLAIAQDLVEQMQGSIQVFSPAHPDWITQTPANTSATFPGTTFIVWLELWH